MVAGMVLVSLQDAMVKLFADDYALHEVMLVRATVALSLTLVILHMSCLLYTSPSPRDQRGSRMPSSA